MIIIKGALKTMTMTMILIMKNLIMMITMTMTMVIIDYSITTIAIIREMIMMRRIKSKSTIIIINTGVTKIIVQCNAKGLVIDNTRFG
jgi:hypothetical protein